MFNPRLTVSHLSVEADASCVVLDDVLAEPQALVDLAQRHREAFTMASTNAFPGLELPLPQAVADRFGELFSQHARNAIGARRVISSTGRLSMVTLQPSELSPLQRLCHRDRLAAQTDQCVGAAVLYLFRNPALGGTNFFRPKQDVEATEALIRQCAAINSENFSRETGRAPAYLTQSNQYFERVAVAPARWNRLICYDGSLFHGSHIEHPQLLTDDPRTGRLTLNLFFLCRKRAG
jgi:Family of unknown function (DUF6445)